MDEGKLYREEGRWAAVSDITRDIPEGIREAIGRRLSRLSDDCNRMLTLASTMTGGFSWDLLLAVSGEEEDRLLDLLDEALRALVVRERADGGAGTYEFTHALIRQTLYGELNTPRRVRLHRQIGEAMEQAYGRQPGAPPGGAGPPLLPGRPRRRRGQGDQFRSPGGREGSVFNGLRGGRRPLRHRAAGAGAQRD